MEEEKMVSDKLNTNCPCLVMDCIFHGKCHECRNYHHQDGEKTYCEILKEENKRFSFARNINPLK